MENSCFRELTRSLQQVCSAVYSAEDDTLLVEVKAQPLCRITAAYMRRMAAAPQLSVSGPSGDYRLLTEFDGVTLARHHSS